MARKTIIQVTTIFAGMHCWVDAPEELEFLRSHHRHDFHVTVRKEVISHDRETEFFMLKERADQTIMKLTSNMGFSIRSLGGRSCEMLADELVTEMNLHSCTVSEDGLYGATVYAEGSE